MWRKLLSGCGVLKQQLCRRYSTATATSAVNSMLLRSLKEHYLQVSKMIPPPKVSPPSPFTVVKGALDGDGTGPVLKRSYGDDDEEIILSVMRMDNIIPGGDGDGYDSNQLFLHVVVSKPAEKESLLFLCALFPDALGIHSVAIRPSGEAFSSSALRSSALRFTGPRFQELDEGMKDAFHSYIEERGVGDSLFPFLQAWLYVKDHRNLVRWFKLVGSFVKETKSV
ncbi:uncharacterized protein At2g39795, mitochondrial [Argentina anserina]|uniref:uncharacterized protein At2g39795, mitochondrial n=1 Tax=Argentina anserina TaxID=57926 RepID=UPI0021765F61|nr:uncharacterized protein At2g39795, mitochondrial [Potentilla anserina]